VAFRCLHQTLTPPPVGVGPSSQAPARSSGGCPGRGAKAPPDPERIDASQQVIRCGPGRAVHGRVVYDKPLRTCVILLVKWPSPYIGLVGACFRAVALLLLAINATRTSIFTHGWRSPRKPWRDQARRGFLFRFAQGSLSRAGPYGKSDKRGTLAPAKTIRSSNDEKRGILITPA
jgi:hypothetical protein